MSKNKDTSLPTLSIESEELLRIFDSIDEPIYISDPETHNVLYANLALRKLFGDVIGKKCYKVFQNLDAPCSFCTNKYIFGKNLGKTHIWEFQNNVNRRWYHRIDRAVPWSGGKMVRYEMAIDITERKEKQEEIRLRNEDLVLFNSLNEAVIRGDTFSDIIDLMALETKKIFFSNGANIYLVDDDNTYLLLKNINYPHQTIKKIEKIIGMKIPDVKIPLHKNSKYLELLKGDKPVITSDKDTIMELMKEHTQNRILKGLVPQILKILDTKHAITIPIVSKGTHFGLMQLSRKEPFTESDVNRLKFLSTHFLTIIKRKRADDALRASELHYRLLAESANDSIFVINNRGEVQYANEIGAKLYGSNPEDIVGKTLQELLPPEIANDFMYTVLKVIETGENLNKQSFVSLPNHEVWLDTTLVPIRETHNRITAVMGVSRDITEYKKAEKEKEKMQSRLFEAEKMKAIADMTGGIAHDFNNMLTAIYGFTDIAKSDIDKTHPVYDYLQQIRQIVNLANELTSQLLGFSRKHPTEFKNITINNIIKNIEKLLQCLIQKDLIIVFDLSPDIHTIRVDIHKIEQVIMNLIVNAKDAMPEGGKITVKTENATLKDKHVKGIPSAEPGDYVCLSVEDSGSGIKKNVLEKIFEPFFTTKSDMKGFGLGLSVVNDTVKQHNGFITIDSKVGKGTTFKVFLPQAQ